MDNYSISYVEQLTGIKAHTLRVWERRYKSLIPHRTATNIRHYDDSQLKKLLHISVLLNHGHKISTLSTYSNEEINGLVCDLFEQSNVDTHDVHINMLINFMLVFDERSFDKVLSNVILKFGFYAAILKVVYPFLRKTGLLWSTDNAAPSQEHFASSIVKRKILTAIDGIPFPVTAKSKFVLFLPPDEWHEIGLLVAEFLVRERGGDCIYLGQNVPFGSLKVAIENCKPTHALTFFTSGSNISQLDALSALCAQHDVSLLVASSISVEQNLDNVVFLESPDALFRYI